MNNELFELIEYQTYCEPKFKKKNQIKIGKKVNEIIDNNVDFNTICSELGLEKKDVAKLIVKRIVDCSK